MNTYVKIILLHLIILTTQAFYMCFVYKSKFKSRRYLYVLAIPLITAFPVILNIQNTYAYGLYEYAITFCLFTAVLVDVVYAAAFNIDYITDGTIRSFHYSYFLICAATVFSVGISTTIRLIMIAALAGLITVFCFIKKHSPKEFINSMPLTIFSTICAWAFLHFSK